jgi:hypothetical protein
MDLQSASHNLFTQHYNDMAPGDPYDRTGAKRRLQDNAKLIAGVSNGLVETVVSPVQDWSASDDSLFLIMLWALNRVQPRLRKANTWDGPAVAAADKLKSRVKAIRIDHYWATHPSESQRRAEAEAVIGPLSARQDRLLHEQGNLGVLKIKEKRALQQQIDPLEAEIRRLRESIKAMVPDWVPVAPPEPPAVPQPPALPWPFSA